MRAPEEWPSCGSDSADKIRLTGPAANFLTDLFLIRGLVLRRQIAYLAHSRLWNDAPVRSHRTDEKTSPCTEADIAVPLSVL